MNSRLLILSLTAAASLGAAETPYTVVERGPHHRVHAQSAPKEALGRAAGALRTPPQSYVELGQGLCYWDTASGQWLDSREEIEIVKDGAAARYGAYQAHFQSNLRAPGAVTLTLPGGRVMRTSLLGLAYTDTLNNRSVMFAEVKDSAGVVMGGNEVHYLDAFSDVKADVVYVYRKGRFSQSIVWRQAPPPPETFGLDPSHCRLECYTELLDAPPASKMGRTVRWAALPGQAANALREALDETVTLSTMRLGRGRAFRVGQDRGPGTLEVAKTLEVRDGRTVLIEALPYAAAQPEMNRLPQAAALKGPGRRLDRLAGPAGGLPPLPRIVDDAKPMRMAALAPRTTGYLVDYELELSSGAYTNYVFEPLGTYYISGWTELYGATFQGGSVLKFSPAGGLCLHSNVVINPDPYQPTVCTARDDDSVGTVLSSSTHTNAGMIYGFPMVTLADGASAADGFGNMKFRYAAVALAVATEAPVLVRNCEFVQCATAIYGEAAMRGCVQNVLMSGVQTCFIGGRYDVVHATIDSCLYLADTLWSSNALNLTNCVVTRTGIVTNGLDLVLDHTLCTTNVQGLFETAGGGAAYLAGGSAAADAGTSAIDTNLLAVLRVWTTEAPLVLAGTQAVDVVLAPRVATDTGAPDLGYHYAPLDYAANNWLLRPGVTAILTNGAALGWTAGTNQSEGWGIILDDARFVSEGTATKQNRIVESKVVQEDCTLKPVTWTSFYDGSLDGRSTNGLCELRLRHTRMAQWGEPRITTYAGAGYAAVECSHSSLRNTWLYWNNVGAAPLTVGITNCLLEWSGVSLSDMGMTNKLLTLQNNLFRDSSLYMDSTLSPWLVRDNVFERSSIDTQFSETIIARSNVLVSTELPPNWTNQIILTNLVYQTGPLGPNYLGGNLILSNRGSIRADLVGLGQYTIRTNQAREYSSIVDIGLHYVALAANGLPVDTDGDGLPDYIEDRNGNGSRQQGETAAYNYAGVLGSDTDGDGVDDYTEYLQGRNPLAGAVPDTSNVIRLEVYSPIAR